MMKTFRFFICLATLGVCLPMAANETTPADSIASVTLQDLMVEGDSQYTTSNITTYIPDDKLKNAAFDATSLLRMMNIPQISVSPQSGELSTLAGESVAIFINGYPASDPELANMRTKNTIKVEFLNHPEDPRYLGNLYVINFVMQEFQYGGYTRIYEKYLFDPDKIKNIYNSAGVFSRFSYKKMTYDLSVNHSYDNNSSKASFSKESFSLTDPDGTPYTATQIQNYDNSKMITSSLPVSLRANYSSGNTFISNTVGFSYSNNPVNRLSGSLNTLPFSSTDYSSYKSDTSRANSLSWDGLGNFVLKNNWSLTVIPSLCYSHSRNNSTYIYETPVYVTPQTSSIINDATDNTLLASLKANAGKSFNSLHRINAEVWAQYRHSGTSYTGNTVADLDFDEDLESITLRYFYSPARWNLQLRGGAAHEGRRTAGIEYNDFYPFFSTSVSYSPDNKNNLAFFWQYATYSPGLEYSTSEIFQSNEFLYYSGNPDVKNYRTTSGNISWTWLPSRMFNMTLGGAYRMLIDELINVYEPYRDGSAVLRTSRNNGNSHLGSVFGKFNLTFLQGSLSFGATPTLRLERRTGLYSRDLCQFKISAQAFYMIKGFNFLLYFNSGDKYLSQGSISRVPSFLLFQCGWSDSRWNIMLELNNPFRSSYKDLSSDFTSRTYSQELRQYSLTYHRRIGVSVSYTFDYGKKINRQDELHGSSGSTNAILR